MKVFIGIDIGTSSVKIIAISDSLELLGEASFNYPTYYPGPLSTEQDPDDWWLATKQALTTLINECKIPVKSIQAFGLTGQMHSLVAIDRFNQVIRKAILWNDQRSDRQTQVITQLAKSPANLIDMVANRSITGFTLSKLLWLKDNEPSNYAKINKILLAKDEIRRRLTGSNATDVSDASGTLLFDVAKRQWSLPMLELMQIDPNILPEAFESTQITGYITKSTSTEIGLDLTGIPVIAGAGDCIAAAVGLGITKQGVLGVSLGTSGILMANANQCLIDYDGRLHSFCHGLPDKWHLMGVNLTGGGALKWFKDAFYSQDDNFYENLNLSFKRERLQNKPQPFFLPYLSGERTPHFDANATGCFIGLKPEHNHQNLAYAVMEGVAFNLRQSLEIMHALHIPVDTIKVTGGGARNQAWLNILSDILGCNLIRLKSEQGPALGVSLLAGLATGDFKDIDQCQADFNNSTDEVEFNEANRQYYNKAYSVYRQLYDDLSDSFNKIANLYIHTIN